MKEWILTKKELPQLNEEAYSEHVLITYIDYYPNGDLYLKTDIAFYDENGISSDGRYMDTPGWCFEHPYKKALSTDKVIAWMPIPKPFMDNEDDYEYSSIDECYVKIH